MHDVSCYENNTNEGNIPQNCKPLTPYVKTNNPDQSCLLDKPILNYEDLGINHWISHLPGNNPVSSGSATVTPLTGSYHIILFIFIKLNVTRLDMLKQSTQIPSVFC